MSSRNQKIVNLIKGIMIIALAGVILVGCSYILTLKSEDGISQFRSYYKQPKESIDLLFMGSSKTYCCISTGVLWENYGISSFDLGGAEAPTWSTYYQMKEALKYQHPKVLAMELSTSALRPSLDPPEFWIEDNAYGMKWNSNRIDLLKVQTSDWLYERIVYPLSTMHGRYNELTADDFIDKNNSVNYKGYDSRNARPEFDTPDVSYVDWEGQITDRANEYFYKIIDLCREEGVELWFFITPYYIEENDQAIYNYFDRVCREEGIPFVNFSDPEHIKAMGFDYATDLADTFHLNLTGSEKYTKYMGGILKEQYNLPDHRGDKYYSSWDRDALTLRMERNNYQMSITESDSEWIDLLGEKGYITFISFGSNTNRASIPHDILSSLVNIGVPLDQFNTGNAIILKDKQIIYSKVAQDIRITVSSGNDRLLFKRTGSDDENRAFETSVNVNSTCYEFEDEGIEILAYDTTNNVCVGKRQIICQ